MSRPWQQIPHARLQSWGRAHCDPFELHTFEIFVEERVDEFFVVATICTTCGRTPLEAITALPHVVPEAHYPDLPAKR